MFDPVIGAIGADTQLWGDIPRHPVIVSLAISSMMYKTDGKRFPGFSESGDYEARSFVRYRPSWLRRVSGHALRCVCN